MSENIRTQILNAAESRFRTYGFGKTTMAEIAMDIEMSTANLYRYYINKMDIGSAMTRRCFKEREAALTKVVEQDGMSAGERLEAFVLQLLDYMHNQFSHEPRISELVNVIVTKRPDLVQEQVKGDRQLIAGLLQDGVERGEFSVSDTQETAEFLHSALVKFSSPFFMAIYPVEELQRQARGVVKLVLNGLIKK